ncbi:MAG TPA: MFS transporter [Acidimicrobiales bacterium]
MSTTELVEEPGARSLDPKRFWALAVIGIAQLMIVLDASVVVVALPSAQHALHISVANRQWVMSAYTLAFGSLLLLGGRIADYVGRRRVFVIGLLGFGAASAIAGLAQNQMMLFGSRALQGGFAAVMAPAALSLLTVTFTDSHERARAFGVYGAIAGSGAALGLVLGGVLTQFASWRWTMLINTPIALIAAYMAMRVIRESRVDERHGYDIGGAITSTGGLFFLVYGFTLVASHGWGSTSVITFLGVAIALLAAFVVIEMRVAHPLLPLKIVLQRDRGGAFLSSLLVGMALLGTFLFLTYFLQGVLGYSALKTGFAFLPFSGGIIVGATLASRLLPRTGARALMIAGLGLSMLGLIAFTRIGAHSGYLDHILGPEILMSIGLGLSFVPMNSTALFGVGDDSAGVASALVNTTQQVGGALGTAFLNTIAASSTAAFLATRAASATVLRSATVHGYTTAFEVSALLVAGAAVVTALFVASRRSSTSSIVRPTLEDDALQFARDDA